MLQPGRRPRKERQWREAIVTSDAASTVGMLVANSGFLPVGRLRRPRPAGLFVFALVATALYWLLKHAHPNAALAIVALVTITTGITPPQSVSCENCLP